MAYVSAKPGPRNSVIYEDADGKRFMFSGGSRAWRNQNPGNLVPGNVSKRNGAIGIAGGFAVFPSYEAGHAAKLDSLRSVYGNKSLSQMIYDYAPPESNKTKKYLAFLRTETGVNDDRKISEFTPEQFEKLWRAIEKMEGNKPGTITELPKKGEISRVRKNKKGTINAYYVEGLGWLGKKEGLELASKGKADAVIAMSRGGKPYLRMRPDVIVENNLEMKG